MIDWRVSRVYFRNSVDLADVVVGRNGTERGGAPSEGIELRMEIGVGLSDAVSGPSCQLNNSSHVARGGHSLRAFAVMPSTIGSVISARMIAGRSAYIPLNDADTPWSSPYNPQPDSLVLRPSTHHAWNARPLRYFYHPRIRAYAEFFDWRGGGGGATWHPIWPTCCLSRKLKLIAELLCIKHHYFSLDLFNADEVLFAIEYLCTT